MKKKIDFSKQGGFPFTQATLEFMQASYKSILQMLISYLGVPHFGHYILSGVETSGTYLTAGWVVVDGEVLPFKQSVKGAAPKIVVKESKRAVIFKNSISQEVYIDRWAEISQTQGTAIAGFTRIKQPADLLEKEAAATFLGVKAKAADSEKLDGKDLTAFLLTTLLSDSPTESRAGRVASSKAVKAVNDKIPSWSTDQEDFLHVICAGKVSKPGTRRDYWGKNRVSSTGSSGTDYPFAVKKLTGTGEYKITHYFGSSFYGLVGNGTTGNGTTGNGGYSSTDGYNMFVSIKEKEANYCNVVVGNDSAPDDGAFSFILFKLK